MNGLRNNCSRRRRGARGREVPVILDFRCGADPGFEVGWEAGIRTPITCSRGMRPTVGRPPSTSRGASKETGTIDYSRSRARATSAPTGPGTPVRASAHLFVAEHLIVLLRAVVIGRGAVRLLFAAMAGHPAFAAGLARFFTRPLVRGALLVRRLAPLTRDLALLVPLHRGKSTILCCHRNLLTGPSPRRPSAEL